MEYTPKKGAVTREEIRKGVNEGSCPRCGAPILHDPEARTYRCTEIKNKCTWWILQRDVPSNLDNDE